MARKRSVWQRLVAMLLCLVFVCAFYGSLTVQAVFGVDDIVIGGALVASAAALTYITVVGLSGSDLAEPLYDAANRANTNINDWLEPKIKTFLQATDGTTLLETQINSLVNGLSYAKDGVLYFSDALGDYIHDFGEWLISNGDIIVSSTSDSVTVLPSSFSELFPDISISVPILYSSSVNINSILEGGNTYNGQFYATNNADEVRIALFNYDGVYRAVFASLSSFTANYYYNKGQRSTSSSRSTVDGQYIYYFSPTSTVYSTGSSSVPFTIASGSGAITALAYAMLFGTTTTGSSSGLDVWNQDTIDGFAVDPTGVIGGSIADADVPAGAIAGVGDYVQAIADAIAGISDITLPVAGVGDIAIDPAVPADVSIPVTPAIPADRADAVPSTGEATPAYPATGDYTLPLADFFPFCIPFDIYKMLSLLSASPEAPSFTWQFYTPGGGSVPIEVDLSQFDTVASVLRAVETLAFCVGLGFVTKKLLFGS